MHFWLHALLFVSSLIVWLPIVSPLPEIPRLQPVLRMLYLFAWSVVPTVPASFLTFGSTPLYKFYEHVPHLFGMSTLEDQQTRGPDHEDRGRTPTVVDHRRSVLPLGLRGRPCEHATARTRRDGS